MKKLKPILVPRRATPLYGGRLRSIILSRLSPFAPRGDTPPPPSSHPRTPTAEPLDPSWHHARNWDPQPCQGGSAVGGGRLG